MLVSNQVKATDIKVFTENGEVFLMGTVTGEQAEAAVDIARNVGKVKKVIKVFNYLNLNGETSFLQKKCNSKSTKIKY